MYITHCGISTLIKQNVTYWHNVFFSETLKTEIIIKIVSFFSKSSHIFSPTEPGSFIIFVKLIALTFCERSTQQNEYAQNGKNILYKKYVSKINNFFFNFKQSSCIVLVMI